MYWIIFIGFALLSWLVSHRLKSKFEAYSKVALPNGMTGKDVAEKMLRDNGIYDVKVISTPGHLTDHYNPGNHTVNLSENVYYSNSVAAAAVAAHECGHAVQHATAYAPLKMRSARFRGQFCFQHRTMGITGWYHHGTEFPAIAAVRNRLVCCHYAFQLYNITR